MAKKDKKKKGDKSSDAADPLESFRGAVERMLHATTEGASGARKVSREIVNEVAQAAARAREALDDIKTLRGDVEGLARRVDALEERAAKAPAARSRASGASASSRPAAAKTRSTAARAKAPSARAKTTGTRKPSTSRSTGSS
jgi:methyl-accepting chemotaxis protein